MTRLGSCGPHSWRTLTLALIAIFVGWPGAQVLRAQDRAGGQGPIRPVEVQGTVQPDSVPNAEREASAEQVSGNAQNPEPQPGENPNPNPAATYQPVTWKNLPIRILGDQKQVWLFPIHVAQGQHLLPTASVVGVTGGLIAADPPIMFHVRRNAAAFDEFREIFSGTNTGIVTALVPATFYMYGVYP